MSNQQQSASRQVLTPTRQAPAAMRGLTAHEMLDVVGGPEIKNGGGGLVIVAPPPPPAPGS